MRQEKPQEAVKSCRKVLLSYIIRRKPLGSAMAPLPSERPCNAKQESHIIARAKTLRRLCNMPSTHLPHKVQRGLLGAETPLDILQGTILCYNHIYACIGEHVTGSFSLESFG